MRILVGIFIVAAILWGVYLFSLTIKFGRLKRTDPNAADEYRKILKKNRWVSWVLYLPFSFWG